MTGAGTVEPTESGGPSAKITGSGGELHLNVGFGDTAIPGFSQSVSPHQLAVGAFNGIAPMHTILVFGFFTQPSASLHDHVVFADLQRTKWPAFSFRETAFLQRARATIGLRPGEIVAGDTGSSFGNAGTLAAEDTRRTDRPSVGDIYCECIRAEPVGTVRWCANRTTELISFSVGLE